MRPMKDTEATSARATDGRRLVSQAVSYQLDQLPFCWKFGLVSIYIWQKEFASRNWKRGVVRAGARCGGGQVLESVEGRREEEGRGRGGVGGGGRKCGGGSE